MRGSLEQRGVVGAHLIEEVRKLEVPQAVRVDVPHAVIAVH